MKKLLLIIAILFLSLTVFELINSYGVFETKTRADSDLKIAKWNIAVNNADLNGQNQTFLIDNITYTNTEGVSTNKFAPGTSGTFLLEIDPQDTEVAFKYELSIELPPEYSQIQIDSIEGQNGTNLTYQDGIYSKVVPLNDVKAQKKDQIKVTFTWLKDANDESDSILGSTKESFEIKVNIKFEQYMN